MEKVKVGVTGADGFIGSHLINELSKNNDIEYTNFNGDLLIIEDIKLFFQNNPNLDSIIHLAGIFSDNVDELMRINVQATLNLLEEMHKNNVKKIIFSSTGAVYGEPIGAESFEDDPRNPNTLYGLSKMYAEDAIFYFNNNYGINYVILRFPNVYGEGNNKGVIYNFVRGIKEESKITVFGNGKQSRNFLHVDDAVCSLIKAISYHNTDVFNISNPKRVAISKLIELLHLKYGNFNVEYKVKNTNTLQNLVLNVEKAKLHLKFEPIYKELILN